MDPSARISNHPVLLHKLTLLRDATTAPHDFRALLSELTFYLGCVRAAMRMRGDCATSYASCRMGLLVGLRFP